MHEEQAIAEDTVKVKESLILAGVDFDRSMLYKGRVAPKGMVFHVAKYTPEGWKKPYEFMQLIKTEGVTKEIEDLFKLELARRLKVHFKLPYWEKFKDGILV